MDPRKAAKALARRHAALPDIVWAFLLDALSTDRQLRGLANAHMCALPNRPIPTDRDGLLDLLIPPPQLPHDTLAAFTADLMKIAPPGAAPPTPATACRVFQEARTAEERARVLWASVCGPDEEIATAAVSEAVDFVRTAASDPEEPLVLDPHEVADAVVQALTPHLRSHHHDNGSRLLERVEQARQEIRALHAGVDAAVARITRAITEATGRHTTPSPNGFHAAVSSALERHLATTPAWADAVIRRLEGAEARIHALASQAMAAPTVRTQRDAWRLAHSGTPLRIALVADLENLTSSTREWRGRRLNFAALRERLGRGGEIVSAAAFAAETAGQGSFLAALRYAGWQPRTRSSTTAAGRPKANWDVGLTLHVVDLAPRVDVVALASGDGDFADLLDWLRAQGIQTRVAAVPEDTAEKIRVAADEFIPVDDSLLMPTDTRILMPKVAVLGRAPAPAS